MYTYCFHLGLFKVQKYHFTAPFQKHFKLFYNYFNFLYKVIVKLRNKMEVYIFK